MSINLLTLFSILLANCPTADVHDDLLSTPVPPPFFNRRQSILKETLMRSTEDLLARRKESYGPNCALVMKNDPVQIVRGQGCSLFDETGREYLDTCNNVASVGHCHPAVVQAVQVQLSKLNTNFRYLHPLQDDFAFELLSTFSDESLSDGCIYLTNSGSETNDLAVRIARAHFHARHRGTTTIPEEPQPIPSGGDMTPDRERDVTRTGPGGSGSANRQRASGRRMAEFHVAVLAGAYHGHLVSTIDLSPYKFMGPGGSHRAPSYVHVIPLPESTREAVNVSARQLALSAVEDARKRGGKIGLFIAESLPSCAGQVLFPPGWLQELYSVFRAEGALCVSDEVQAGLGRLGSVFWGYELHGVQPDMVAMGKGLGDGFPVSALVCTKAAVSAFSEGMEYFNTFGGCTAAIAAATATLRAIREERLQENAGVVGECLLAQLQGLQRKFPEILYSVRGAGLMVGIEVAVGDGVPAPLITRTIQARIRKRGVLISVDGIDGNVIKVKPPLTFGTDEVDLFVLQLGAVLQEMKLEGAFGEAPLDLFLSGGSQAFGIHGRDSSHNLGGEASGYQSRHSELSVCPEDAPMDEMDSVFGKTPQEMKALELKLLRELSDSAASQSARVASPMGSRDLLPGAFSSSFSRGYADFDTESMSSQRSGDGQGRGGGPSVSSAGARDGSRRTSVYGGERQPMLPPLEEEDDAHAHERPLGHPAKESVDAWLEGLMGQSFVGRAFSLMGLDASPAALGLVSLSVGLAIGSAATNLFRQRA